MYLESHIFYKLILIFYTSIFLYSLVLEFIKSDIVSFVLLNTNVSTLNIFEDEACGPYQIKQKIDTDVPKDMF